MGKFNIEFYYNNKNQSPVGDWLETIEQKVSTKYYRVLYKKINHLLHLVEEFGPGLSMPDNLKIEDVSNPPIWELRIKGNNDYRIFWTLWKGSVLLLHWIKKDTNRTSAREFKKCKTFYIDWVNRFGE